MNFFTSWLNQHHYSFVEGVVLVHKSFWNFIFSTFVVGIITSIFFIFYLGYINIDPYVNQLKHKPVVSLYLKKDLSSAQLNTFKKEVSSSVSVIDIQYQSKSDILKKMEGSDLIKETVNILEENPFPSVIQIKIDQLPSQSIPTWVENIKKIDWVDKVYYSENISENLYSIQRFILIAIVILLILFVVIFVVVTFNTLRLIQIKHLNRIRLALRLGATPQFIRRVFYYQGLIFGIFSGLWALVLSLSFVGLIDKFLRRVNFLENVSFHLILPPIYHWISLMILCMVITWFASILSVRFFWIRKLISE